MVKDRESYITGRVWWIMGFLIPAAIAVAGFLISVSAVVATVITTVVTVIVTALSAVYAAIAAVVASVTAAVASTLSAIYASVASTLMPVFSTIKSVAQALYHGIQTYVQAISAGWKAFAEAIHLKTLIQIHRIAYMVSAEYRNMMSKVWAQVSEVSSALGYGSTFLLNAFSNARNLALLASGIMGKKYDLAEVAWLSQWSGALKEINTLSAQYTAYPQYIIQLMDRYTVEGSIDAVGGSMQTVYTTISDVILSVESAVEKSVEIRDDLEEFVSELPSSIQDRVRPMLDPVIEKFDGFYADTYRPKMDIVDGVMKEVGLTIKIQKDEINELVDRLKRPGDILVGVEGLPIPERDDQEEKITRASTVRFDRDRQAMMHDYIPKEVEFLKLRDALLKKYPPPEYEVPEVEAPARPAGTPVEPRKTWNVGDY